MTVWAIADLHLSLGVSDKKMDIFGWDNHEKRLADNWRSSISPDDLVLIPGDISWALKIDEVKPDLDFLHALPGTKVLLKGNHDYWWPSNQKLQALLPPSIHFIHNTAFHWHDIAIGGTRLWDSPEFHFDYELKEDPSPIYER